MALSIFQVEEKSCDQELILFILNEEYFALNVLKVKEIIRPLPISASPNRHAVIEGVIRFRDEAIPVINTYQLMDMPEEESLYFIIAEVGQRTIALKVSNVLRIVQAHSEEMKNVHHISQGKETFVSGMMPLEERQFAYLLDLEKVIHFIHPIHFDTDFSKGFSSKRGDYPIILLEDSVTIRQLIVEALHDAGYDDVTTFSNGLDAVKYLREDDAFIEYEAIVTDIDMPFLNGLEFTKRIRQTKRYEATPILSFSSLEASVMAKRGESVGVTFHVAKPDIPLLIEKLDTYLIEKS
ncbi:chemotaxis protein CheV [Bacillus sp. JCM 19041]|uniref:chemotaxis protein CheV n=1 Tax=Bacillus sp. JCM 19041 TaxID=1460637 RepID=UPI0006D01778